ncbi:cobalamin biosynthesis protein P47K [Verrucomicrobia bacterium]|jgi:G3E family GTPase|nr:cobalamin biosynthesis protein P47K [Verrucomicrobiota bacterium]
MTEAQSDTQKKPSGKASRYIMIGGFLGAGKTTAVAQLASHLDGKGLKVGLITNDQGSGLVDTASLRAKGFATEEIPGGCFCCRFNSLMDAANRLTESSRPDVFIAEPVGSCTDLVATVTYPLRRIYGENFRIAPLSVLVDPVRAQRVLGLAEGGRFSDKVVYIYKKQLEEANLIVINKMDLLSSEALADLEAALKENFPQARVLSASARDGEGLSDWFEILCDETQPDDPTMQIDYDTYAEGEALLGWLNATIEVRHQSDSDGNELVREIANRLQDRLRQAGAEIAHLKMTLTPDGGLGDLAVVNVVRNDIVPELGQRLDDLMQNGQLILNLRAESDPEALESLVRETFDAVALANQNGLVLKIDDLERFRPGRPEPTHRDLVEITP